MAVAKTMGILVLLLTSLAAWQPCYAQEIVIGMAAWPPFRIVEDDQFSGIDVDLCREIEKRLPVRFRFENIPWIRSLDFMKQGRIDAMTGLARTEERQKYILYTQTPYHSECSSEFYLRKGEGQRVKNYKDLYHLKIGCVSDSAYFEPFNSDKKLTRHVVTHEVQLLRMLHLKRLEIIIGTNCQVDYHIKKEGLLGKFDKAHYKPNNAVDLYVGLSRKSTIARLHPELSRVIKELKKEGVVDRIVRGYFQ